MFVIFFLFGIILGVGIVVAVGAVFLRGGVWLANKVFSPVPRPLQPPIDLPSDFLEEEKPTSGNPFAKPMGSTSVRTTTDSNPYAAPQSYGSLAKVPNTTPKAIPEPNFGKACGINFILFLIAFGFNFVVASLGGLIAAQIIGLIFGFFVAVLIYGAMLPTTPGKAAVVYLFQLLLIFAVAVASFFVLLVTAAIFA